jgi:integrase
MDFDRQSVFDLVSMTTELVPPAQASLELLAKMVDQAQRHAMSAHAKNTLGAYESDWRHFSGWCEKFGLSPLPASAEVLATYVSDLSATHGRSVLQRRLAAIGHWHRAAGLAWQTGQAPVRATMRGAMREHGKPVRKAAALTTDDVVAMIKTCPDNKAGLRDRALLLIGYAGALRRSEIVGIDREHLTFSKVGLRILLPGSKGDADRQGVVVGIPKGQVEATCAGLALKRWLDAAEVSTGPVFRKVSASGAVGERRLCGDAVRVIVRRRALLAGIEVPADEGLSAHGLRAGFVTEAVRKGVQDEVVMGHSRHKDLKTMRGYVRRAKLVHESPVMVLGL